MGTSERIKVLAVVAPKAQDEIRRQLSSFGVIPTLASNGMELVKHVRGGERFHVALLPATLPIEDDWWAIWGELSTLNKRPAVLVYAQTASFQLWSGVLEAGGYDVIVEPLTDEKLRNAIFRAAESYCSRSGEVDEQG
jgi:DNA-binding NtrC family response regulator